MEASDAKKRAGSPMAAGVLPGFFFTEFIKNNISIVPVHSRHHRAPPHFRLGVFFFLYSLPSNFYRIPMRVTFDVQLFFFCFFWQFRAYFKEFLGSDRYRPRRHENARAKGVRGGGVRGGGKRGVHGPPQTDHNLGAACCRETMSDGWRSWGSTDGNEIRMRTRWSMAAIVGQTNNKKKKRQNDNEKRPLVLATGNVTDFQSFFLY